MVIAATAFIFSMTMLYILAMHPEEEAEHLKKE
jgi:hypothetical protein